MNFGTGPTSKTCSVCQKEIPVMDNNKIQVEKYWLHLTCFTCPICDVQLKQGSCARDHGLDHVQVLKQQGRKAPVWFCKDHSMLGSGEKLELLKKKYGSGGPTKK
ncbi:hypothetical protein M3Y94_00109800 [Aphelenchoides besseyi]|nr:hypothetical protein M3Y94_00109800 [Aphelenchoides besseyi]